MVRTDIQGLRALAVSLVLVYHLVPDSLSGGFIGVDVFFVISGYLITLHLLGNIPTNGRGLVDFWSRRVRRLLPASLLVLGATLLASRLFAPETQWANTAEQTRAAALYFLNWVLAGDAVDYLAAGEAASPVQHFWSLAVEEQFYLLWPVLILLLGLLARRLGRENRLHVILGGLVLVVGASLAYSVHITGSSPAEAYFVTPARIWELGVGAILATVVLLVPTQQDGHRHRAPSQGMRPSVAVPLAWAGLAAIAFSAATYSSETPFPGWQAAVPVLGTAAVIAAQSTSGSGSPGTLFSLPPVQWLGDVSYSVYLWHWPLVVILPQATGHSLTAVDRIAIVAATLGLAWLTKLHVEDRFRTASWALPRPKPFAVAAMAMALVVAGSAGQLYEVDQLAAQSRTSLERGLSGQIPCFGAAALDNPKACPAVSYDDLVPRPLDAASDKSDAYATQKATGTDCWSYYPGFPLKTCSFGRPQSTTNVILTGNSHAGQWLPALQRIADQENFRITTYLASECAVADLRQEFDTEAQSTACRRWVDRTTQKVIELKPDLVVMTNRISAPAEGRSRAASTDLYTAGYKTVLDAWVAAGIPVLVLRDTPYPGDSIPDCVAQKQDDYADCDGPLSKWAAPKADKAAVSDVDDPDVRFLDLTQHICGPKTCQAVTGGVITYFDASHLTATYATTVSPYLRGPISEMLRSPAPLPAD